MKSLSRVRLSATPVDCNLLGFSVHGILQARILEGVTISFSKDLLDPGIEPRSPALEADALTSELRGKPHAHRNNQMFFRSTALSKDHMLPKPLNYDYFNETVSYGGLE